jgi:ATP-dependent Clp protease ATP-binding subunit ClpA
LDHILEVINTYTSEFKQIPSIDRTLSNRYGQKLEDIQEWLSKTIWGKEQVSEKTLNEVQSRLFDLNLVDGMKPVESFLWR